MPLIPPPGYGDEKEELWSYFLLDLESMVRAIISLDWASLNIIWILLRADWRNLWDNVESYALEVGQAAEDWINLQAANIWSSLQLALDWIGLTWDSLGSEISSGWYTAVSWAEAKKDEAIEWAKVRYDAAKVWASNAWDWVRDRGPATWDWIRDKSCTVWSWISDKSGTVWDFVSYPGVVLWNWFLGVRMVIEEWWAYNASWVDTWRTTYLQYYLDLFDNYRDDLLSLLEDPPTFSLKLILLDHAEQWLYERWFGEVA